MLKDKLYHMHSYFFFPNNPEWFTGYTACVWIYSECKKKIEIQQILNDQIQYFVSLPVKAYFSVMHVHINND